jgi:thiamine-monophosphate kinase
MGEFELIDRFFRRTRPATARVPLGVGDDCALLAPGPGMQLAVSTDMLLEGRHFLPTVDPALLGHKALAVNLSDLAACGARPLGFTLSLALPGIDAAWLEGFSRGLFALADQEGCELVGGDTTRGPLAISITVFGEVPAGQALLRSGARAGDDLYVSGTLGDARLALEVFRGQLSVPAPLFELARRRMDQPTPRVALGQALRGVASAAVDVSDGLLGDLGHMLRQSQAGATIQAEAALPLLAARTLGGSPADLPGDATQLEFVLAGGDDYELLFTAPAAQREAVAAAAAASATPVTRIGRIDSQRGVRVLDGAGREIQVHSSSFDHFA